MIFEYDENTKCYKCNIIYRDNYKRLRSIDGIFDTGCSDTAIGLYFLNYYILENPIIVTDDIIQQFNGGYSYNAGGGASRSIDIMLPNMILSDGSVFIDITGISLKVNVDDNLIYTNGCYNINGYYCKASPYILVGLDIIRYFDSILFRKNYVVTNGFNLEKYISEVRSKRGYIRYSNEFRILE